MRVAKISFTAALVATTSSLLSGCGSSDSSSPPPAHSSASTTIQNASSASPSDVAQAEKFLADMPAACSDSSGWASSDGTVTVHMLCNGNGKSMDGMISIKNGVVTKVK